MVVLRTPEKPRELAAVTQPAEPPAPAVARQDAAPVTPPVAQPTPVRAKVKAAEPVAENAPTAAGPPPPPAPPQRPKAETAAQAPVDAVKKVEPAIAPPPPLPPPPAPVVNGFVAGAAPQLQGGAQNQDGQQAFAGGGRGGGGGGGKGGGRGGRAPQADAARIVTTRFSYDYSFDASGALRIVPSVPGYLSVTVPDQPTPTVLLPARNVVPDTPVVVQIPPDASDLVVSFSATPAAITGTPARREESWPAP